MTTPAPTRDEIIKEVASQLRDILGPQNLLKSPYARSTLYVQPPLVIEPRKDNLHLVRRPKINMTADEALVAFDAVADLVLKHPNEVEAELGQIVSGAASMMIRRFATPEARLVATLWYLGGANDVRLEYDDHSCLIHANGVRRGIFQGQLESRFTQHPLRACYPKALITRSGHQVKATEPTMIMAYALAKQEGNHGRLAETVALLYQATTPRGFRRLMAPDPLMPRSEAIKLEQLVFDAQDPVFRMYKLLVPRWMGASQFQRVFGSTKGRPMQPDILKRNTLFTKLSALPFYPHQIV